MTKATSKRKYLIWGSQLQRVVESMTIMEKDMAAGRQV